MLKKNIENVLYIVEKKIPISQLMDVTEEFRVVSFEKQGEEWRKRMTISSNFVNY